MSLSPKVIREALVFSLPVAFGYIPMGMAFGVLLHTLGLAWWWGTLMGILIYAGAAQFLAVNLLSQKAGLLEVWVTTLLLNSRHLFYGLLMQARYHRFPFIQRLYSIFSLTDETFSIITTHPGHTNDARFVSYVSAFNHLWWILGCTLGGLLSSHMQFNSNGLEFSLVCMFAVLLYETWHAQRQWRPIIFAICAAASVAFFLGMDNFLIKAIAVLLLLVALAYRIDLTRTRRLPKETEPS